MALLDEFVRNLEAEIANLRGADPEVSPPEAPEGTAHAVLVEAIHLIDWLRKTIGKLERLIAQLRIEAATAIPSSRQAG